ncbi:MAG: PAS domain S-box protein [Verrucomicrobiae bacterium]|nr:PAS domain S-box protein [Verrucomicrobiae bacterium]
MAHTSMTAKKTGAKKNSKRLTSQARRNLSENEVESRAVVDAFDGFIYRCSKDLKLEYMNRKLVESAGCDGVGMPCHKVLYGLDEVCPWCANDRVFSGQSVRMEIRNPRDGRWYYVVNTPVRHADGSISKQGMAIDITEQKTAREALHRAENFYRTTVNSLEEWLHVADRNLKILYANKSMTEAYGGLGGRMPLIGRKIQEAFPFLPDWVLKEYEQVFSTGKVLITQEKLQVAGQERMTETRKVPVVENGRVVRVMTVIQDVTERHRNEMQRGLAMDRMEILLKLHQMGQAGTKEILDYALEGAVKITRSRIGYLALVNKDETVLTMHSWSREAMAECAIRDKPMVFEVAKTGLWGEAVRQRRPIITNDYKSENSSKKRYPKGHVSMNRYMNIPIFDGTRMVALAGVGNKAENYDEGDVNQLTLLMNGMWQILQRRKAEEALRDEKERLAVTLVSIGDGVITTDCQGRIVMLNRMAERLTGWTQAEAAGRLLTDIFHIVDEETRQPCPDPILHVLELGKTTGVSGDILLLAKDGSSRAIEDSGAPIRDEKGGIIGVVLVFRDITEKRKAEEELLRADKLESIGLLAGGIAHDFNNILTVIMGNLSVAMLGLDSKSKIAAQLGQAERASRAAKDLTEQLLTFSKGGAPVRRTLMLADLIHDAVGFALRGSSVHCEYQLADDLWTVHVDPSQIGRVINNLALNAVQAMPRGGVLVVVGDNLVLDVSNQLPLSSGPYVHLSFRDTGGGIASENFGAIFDPFFTTKKEGSGLGLSIAYSIMIRHDGYITAEPAPGGGAIFHLYIPASGLVAEDEKTGKPGLIRGSGRVLVMDDEEYVRDVACCMLETLGYESVCVKDGRAAVETFEKARTEGSPFDVVILDLTVPGGMGGREALDLILAIDPAAVVVASSGYSHDAAMADFAACGFKARLPKPYTIVEAGEMLRELFRKTPNKQGGA